MLPLLFHPAVREDLARARLWYGEISPGLRAEFDRCLEAALDRIERHPRMYAIVEGEYRKAPLPRFPYQIFYRVGTNAVIVYEVSHEQADPVAQLSRVSSRNTTS